MKRIIILSTLITFVLLGSSFTSPVSNTDKSGKLWTKLGSKKANYGLDRDVIHVGKYEGSFTKLKLNVKGGGLNMHRMIVEYGDGSQDKIPLTHNFRKGSNSRVIDLEGRRRKIKDITFVYDTKNLARKKAVVTVWGRR